MGNTQTIQKLNFINIQNIIKSPSNSYVLINTLSLTDQKCLIPTTISGLEEETIINTHLNNKRKDITIIIYGKNCNDNTITHKYSQLQSLGFINISIYLGGLFEWLLLQDIYGSGEFPTTSLQLDILKYK